MGFGVVKVPAGWDFAKIIVVSGNASVIRLSHVAALADRTAKACAAGKAMMDASKARKGIAKSLADAQTLMEYLRTGEYIRPEGMAWAKSATRLAPETNSTSAQTRQKRVANAFFLSRVKQPQRQGRNQSLTSRVQDRFLSQFQTPTSYVAATRFISLT